MARSLLVAVVLLAVPAFATGERIMIASATAPFADQLKETLCVSMECIDKGQAATDGFDATVTARAAKNQVEVKVVGADGVVRLTQKVLANDAGRISSTDLVSATSAILAAIESPAPAAKAAHQALAKAKKKPAAKLRLMAKARAARVHG